MLSPSAKIHPHMTVTPFKPKPTQWMNAPGDFFACYPHTFLLHQNGTIPPLALAHQRLFPFSNKHNSTNLETLQIVKHLLPALYIQHHLVLQPNTIFTFSNIYHCFQLTSAWSCLPKYMSDEIAFTLPNFFCASSVLKDGSYSGLRRDAGLKKNREH